MILDTERLRWDVEYKEEIRHRFLSDHFFAAELIGFKKFSPALHRQAVDLYFAKNPRLPIEEQHRVKNRMHLDPRGTFKTTLGRVDSLQWVCAFPEDITILNETATQDLAEEISAGIARFFYKPKDRAPTLFQLAFSELVVEKPPQGTWSTASHRFSALDLDATLDFTSPKTSQSGWHPWVECIDDMVDTENSGKYATAEVRDRVFQTYSVNKNTLRAGGYINLRGTRYHPEDLYGRVLSTMDPAMWRVLIRGSLTVISGRAMLPGEFPDEDDVILHFAELPDMDYRSLRQKFMENYESFMGQQQNDPQGGHISAFPEKLFHSMLCEQSRIPALGDTYAFWRFPCGSKDYMREQAEGICGRAHDGKAYVLDAWKGTYTPSRLAVKVVDECKKHQVETLFAEAVPGYHHLETHIRNEALRRNLSLRIHWLEFEDDDNCRIERIRNLEPQAQAGRVMISTSCNQHQELHRQFVNFGIVQQNGLIDCVSRLAARVPMSVLRAEIAEDEQEWQARRNQNMMYHFAYGGLGGVLSMDERRRQEKAAHDAAIAAVDECDILSLIGGN